MSRRELEEWRAPFPSARELAKGGFARAARADPSPPRPRDIAPRRRYDSRRDQRPGADGPTPFGPDG